MMKAMRRSWIWSSAFGAALLLTLMLMLLATCGARDSGGSATGAQIQTPTLTPNATASVQAAAPSAPSSPAATQVASVAAPGAVATATPRVVVQMSGTVEDMPDLAHLVWTSNAIVRGRVSAALPAQQYSTDQGYAENQIYTDYVVQVVATLRGLAQPMVTVRRYGGTVGDTSLTNATEPELRVGDEAVFFLAASTPTQSKSSLWLNGGPQGFWPTQGAQLASAPFGVGTVGDLANSIASILATAPPADLTLANGTIRYVPLDVAPPGVDLPPAPTQASPTAP